MSAGRHITKAKCHFFKNDDFNQVLTELPAKGSVAKTKIAITVGPACQTVEKLVALLEAGVTCARIDLTWAPIEYHRTSLLNLQEAMRRTKRLCAVMLDCLGRELMIKRKYGVDENGWPGIFEQLRLKKGQKVTITTDTTQECTSSLLPITYPKFPAMCERGDQIFLGRYLVTGADESSVFLTVEEVTPTEVVCVAASDAVLDGLLTVFHIERSGESLSNLQNDLPALTDFDKQAIATLCNEFEVDFVTISYCRSAEDVFEAREFLAAIGQEHTKVIAKCETRQSLFNFRTLVDASDAIIISRGNLGLDVVPEKMAMIQKAMVSTCAILGKPSIITRVVDTMIRTPRPTRAEATDIANAVLDGVDAIMLGAETYRGNYALETVKTVSDICRAAEEVFDHANHFEHLASESEYFLGSDEDPELPRHKADRRLGRTISHASLGSDHGGMTSMHSMAMLPRVNSNMGAQLTYTAKLESVAASAVKSADKVGAALMVVVTHTGMTAAMVAKYRPAMPIMTLVVPYLKRDGLKWKLEGRHAARQALLTSGLLPTLAAPTPSAGEGLIEEAVQLALANGWVKPLDHVVVLSRSQMDEFMVKMDEFMVKIVSVDEHGLGIKRIRPKSLLDMLKAAGHCIPEEDEEPAPPRALRRPSAVLQGRRNEGIIMTSAGAAANGTAH
ncbi:pyruvate kinase isoform C [Chlorella sorokiniana]|uniref:Pyruvate kinase n=1 Tax=Chlorella sorokiniana TaxID=3076 RepID=A0A2P6TUN1_CHLSO|nr:pyruvate kinase isoform C [Chlorella sorokiniana]|eukprot:PRW57775.1 pyruvate kinase isoform C [Chlorella sorokiniana]